MKNEDVDFLEWLHEEREQMEKEKKELNLSSDEWTRKVVEELQKKGFVVERAQKAVGT